ncbi:glycosyltransferase [Edwardsiella ictaluri]|uniref:glycosyltransferase n=1 Tax=Edwardsiella ictaluri TaxID=67780 RepID=UPI0018DCE3AE|nr:glycosyltransferase [Edwardsiella ictaluri]QPW26370.1 glycosyltransferase [Edwardsiella ictaluri]
MKKIFFVITKSEIGGAQKWIVELSNILKEQYEIFIITSGDGWLTSKFDSSHVILYPGLLNLKSIFCFFKLANIFRKYKADVVISSSANAGVYARLSKFLYSHKSIYVSHGWSCLYNGGRLKKIQCLVERFLSLISDKILCVSENDMNNAIKFIGIKEKKLFVIRNGVSPLKKKNVINVRKKVLFVGRMIHPKRPDLFVAVADSFPDVDFYLVGDGPLKQRLETSCQHNNVYFLGEINGFDSFQCYDIFVLCSDSEGLPMSALEAAASGVPILLSDVGGCSELITLMNNGCSNGELFSNDISSLRCKLGAVLLEYDKYFSSAQVVSGCFDINNLAEKYIELIEGDK